MHKLKDKLRKKFGKQHSDEHKGAEPKQTEQSVDASLTHPVSTPISNPDPVTSPDPVAKPDLWQRAFDALDPQKQKLIKSISIAKSDRPIDCNGLCTNSGVIDRLNTLNDVVETVKTQYEIDQAKSRIRAPAQKIITSVLGFQDLIQAAVGFDPTGHATSVWAIVSLGLNLDRGAVPKGTEIDQSMETSLVGVYTAVLTFAAQVQSLYDRNRAVFLWKSTFGESLSDLRESITEAESDLSQWLDIVDRSEQQERGTQLLEMAETMLAGIDRVMDSLNEIYEEVVFAKLKTADADYKAEWGEEYPECLKDTRVDLLRDIKDWATSPDRNAVFWLQGMAGTGKSTVSRTVARWLDEEGLLAGSFFFKKGGTDREDAARLFTTLTKQILRVLPCLHEPVKSAINETRDIGSNPKEQFDKLIFKPLKGLNLGLKVPLIFVIVIDALDECQVPAHVESFFSALPQLAELKEVRLRFFITSRPEPPVTKGFRRMINDEIILHQIQRSTIENDISVFLEKRLQKIRHDRGLGESWPGEDTLKALVNMAVPLFIYAATICRFVNCEGESPKKRLQAILSSRSSEGMEQIDGEYSKLTNLYLPVLQHVVCEKHPKERSNWMDDFRQFVGAVALLFSPLSSVCLAKLICADEEDVQSRFSTLQSVLSVPKDSHSAVQLLHLSFRDFLVDCSASNEFWIDEPAGHKKLAKDCLQCMRSRLKRNICCLSDPAIDRDDISKTTLESHVSPELRYACRYWMNHLKGAGNSGIDWGQIEEFLKANFLHWLELMSIFGWFRETIGIIKELKSLAKSSYSASLTVFLRESYYFVLRIREKAQDKPLQIYYGGLSFTPRMSQIREEFDEDLPASIYPLPRGERGCDAELQILESHWDHVQSVAFSPDGTWVVSVSDDGTMRFYDTGTGALKKTLEVGPRELTSVVVSPDGLWLAAGTSSHNVLIWDTVTGIIQQTLEGHSDTVNSVAVSRDGAWLASGSDDKTICIWDAKSHALQHTLDGHSYRVNSIAFSPNSAHLASASDDGTMRIWETATGVVQQVLQDHSYRFMSVAFSPDGTSVASGLMSRNIPSCDEPMIHLWDTTTGALKHTLEGAATRVDSMAFSPNGAQLASASFDGSVHLWNTATRLLQQTLKSPTKRPNRSIAFSPTGTQLVSTSGESICLWDMTSVLYENFEGGTFEGHLGAVFSAALSPDGTRLASGSHDNTICLWDTTTGVLQQTLRGHPDKYIYSIAFSPNGTQLASSSDDGTFLWDIAASVLHDNLEGQTLEGHSGIVLSIGFSPDGKLLATGSDDNTIRLWDPATGALQHVLRGHTDYVRSVVFSTDGTLLASSSQEKNIRLWDTMSGQLKHMISVSVTVTDLRFDHEGSYLITNCGSFDVESGSRSQVTRSKHANWDMSVGLQREWIVLNGKNVLWLPPGYRPALRDCFAISGDLLALGLQSGSVLFIRFNLGRSI